MARLSVKYPEWTDTAFKLGAFVTYDGGVWRAIQSVPTLSGAPDTASSLWEYAPHHTRWRNMWISGDYRKFDVVRDGDWTMVANKDTAERAAPQLNNNPTWDLVEASWVTNQNQSVVQAGREWDVTAPVQLKSYEVWGLDDSGNTTYRVFIYLHQTGVPEDIQFTQLPDPIINPGGWQLVESLNVLLAPGLTFGIILEAVTSTSVAQVTGNWTRQENSNNINRPDDESWRTRDNEANLRISDLDTTSADRHADLMYMGAGTVINIAESTDANRWMRWRINAAPVDRGGSVLWEDVTYEGSGPSGEPRVGRSCLLTAAVPAIGQTEYVQFVGGNPSVNTRGLLSFDGVAQVGVESDAFGVRVLYDRYTVSEDWDIMSMSGSGASAGGGDEGGGGEGGIPEAPIDGEPYNRQDAAWVQDTSKLRLDEKEPGYMDRAKFWIQHATNGILRIEPCKYHVQDVGVVWTHSSITYYMTSLLGGQWSFVYLNTGTLPEGGGEFTADDLIDSRTVPTYDYARGGWYRAGVDRCIFAIKGVSTGSMYQWFHSGGKEVIFNTTDSFTSGALSSSVKSVTPGVSPVTRKISIDCLGLGAGANGYIYTRDEGSRDSVVALLTPTDRWARGKTVYVNDSQQFGVKTTGGTHSFSATLRSYFLEDGM